MTTPINLIHEAAAGEQLARYANPWTIQLWNHTQEHWQEFCIDAPITLAQAESRIEEFGKDELTSRAKFRAVPWFNNSQRQHAESELSAVTRTQRDKIAELENEQGEIIAARKQLSRVLSESIQNTETALNERDAAKLELAALRGAQQDHSPGTPLGRLKGICEYAEKNCGHTRYSAKSGESAIIEALESSREEAKRLREAIETVCCRTCGYAIRKPNGRVITCEACSFARKALADPPCSKPEPPTQEEMLRGAADLEAVASGIRDMVAGRVTPIEQIDPSFAAPCNTCGGTNVIDQHQTMTGNATDLAICLGCPDCVPPCSTCRGAKELWKDIIGGDTVPCPACQPAKGNDA